MQVFTPLAQKLVFKKREQGEGRDRNFQAVTKAVESSLQSKCGPAAQRRRGEQSSRAQRPEGKRPEYCVQLTPVSSSSQSPAPFFTWPGQVLWGGSRTVWLPASRAMISWKAKCNHEVILNSHQESSASMQADKRKNKGLPPPRVQQLEISPIASPAYDLKCTWTHHRKCALLGAGPSMEGLFCKFSFLSHEHKSTV